MFLEGLVKRFTFASLVCPTIDISLMPCRDSYIMRVTPRVRPGMRISEFPTNAIEKWCRGARQSGPGASSAVAREGANVGTGAVTGAAGVAPAIAGGRISTYSGITVPGDELDGPAPAVGPGGISGSRGRSHVTSREDTNILVSPSTYLKYSLPPWL